MKRPTLNESREVNFFDENWMIKLGQLTTVFDRVVVKNFEPTSISIGFVRAIASDHGLIVRSFDVDLVLEKQFPRCVIHAPQLVFPKQPSFLYHS